MENASSPSSNINEPLQLDYDKRMRAPPLETSAKAALLEFEHTQYRIRELFSHEPAATELDSSVRLSATTPAEVELGSTLGREVRKRAKNGWHSVVVYSLTDRFDFGIRVSLICHRCGLFVCMLSITLL